MVEVGKSIADDSEWQAEIAKIKQKKAELAQKMNSVRDDPEKRRALEAQIAAVDAELAAKDTESYRKQRTTVQYLGSTMMSAEDAMKLS
jgi:septal ring factor EnvC (AmiA/AmiB activator)